MENIVRKEEIACYKQFLLFSQCFLPDMALVFHFKCTLKCHLQFVSIWTSLKFCCLVMGYLFTKRENFRLVQIQSICIRQNKCGLRNEDCLLEVKNIVEKGENAGYQYFLLFPQYFQKSFLFGGGGGFVKSRDCVVKN